MKLAKTVALAAFSIGSMSGCGPKLEKDAGFLTVRWTIFDTTAQNSCESVGASAMELLIFDSFGFFVDEVEAPCEDFQVTLDLFEGSYEARSTLVTLDDIPVSLTHVFDPVFLDDNEETILTVDFEEKFEREGVR